MRFLKKGWPFVFAAIVVSIGAFIFGRAQKPPAPIQIYKATTPATPKGTQKVSTRGPYPLGTGAHLSVDEILPTDESLDMPHADTPEMRRSPIGAPAPPKAAQPPSNPVPREVIEDSERDLEWWRADREYMKKYWALREEREELSQELKSLTPKNLAEKEHILSDSSRRAQHLAKLEAWREKFEDWLKRDAKLKTEKPVRPTPTHTH